jgi:hypothetical protein
MRILSTRFTLGRSDDLGISISYIVEFGIHWRPCQQREMNTCVSYRKAFGCAKISKIARLALSNFLKASIEPEKIPNTLESPLCLATPVFPVALKS